MNAGCSQSTCLCLAVTVAPGPQDKEGAGFQRLTWDALRKSLNGLVNKVNSTNIKEILPEFFGEVRS